MSLGSFYVVTPSFNVAAWLSACLASVQHQAGAGIRVHHHVQDGGSRDATLLILKAHQARTATNPTPGYSFSYASEKDAGMYDAINRGWSRADEQWTWLGHLNADEQYQPNVLLRVADTLNSHTSWGGVTGNCIWVDEAGRYLCSRKPSVAWPWVGRIWIPAFTCAFFFRRVYFASGIRFDTTWKSLGDKVFCRDLLNAGCRFGYLDSYMATFMQRGDANLGYQPVTEIERSRYHQECLRARERAYAPLAIAVARGSRAWRCAFGRRCESYTWVDESGHAEQRAVEQHRWQWTRN